MYDFSYLKKSRVGVAVSGGSDSLAMLNIIAEQGLVDNITVLHFNHNLRKESASEAEWLSKHCANLGVKIIVGKWEEPITSGNLQQSARVARYNFFKQKCEKYNLDYVLVAHTKDDLAETFLMRLARGSGLKGLSAMQQQSNVFGVKVIRPFLSIGREELQKYLKDKNIEYISDPSNENEKFFRIRIRKLKEILHNSGLTYRNICESSNSLRRANNALEFYADEFFKNNTEFVDGKLYLDAKILSCPEEVAIRVLEKSILNITDDGLAPRTSKRIRALGFIKDKKIFTLGNVKFTPKAGSYILEKECK